MRSIPLSGIKQIEHLVSQDRECISLSQGKMATGGIPREIKRFVQEQLNTCTTDYYSTPTGIPALREQLSKNLSLKYQSTITVENILPTHGCIGALSLIFLTILRQNDEVIIPTPAYPAYWTLTLAAHAHPVFVSTETESGWQLSINKIKAACTEKTKIIIFSNPWNPLGIIVPQETINELALWCEKRKIYLIIDEAYEAYVFGDIKLTPIIPRAIKSNYIISTHSFSKSFAMSGWRIGYVVAHKKLIEQLTLMQDALLNSLNNPAQYAALYAIQNPNLNLPFKEIIETNKDLALNLLQPLQDKGYISFSVPNGGFFFYIKVYNFNVEDLCFRLINEAKVGLIPGSTFEPDRQSNSIRLCIAREKIVLQEGINRLVNFFLTNS